MKRIVGALVLVAATALTGCELFQPKKGDQGGDANSGGDAGGGDANAGGGGGGFDATTMVTAPGKVDIGKGAKVGFMLKDEMTAGGQTMGSMTAIVADGGDVWHVEHVNAGLAAMANSMPDLKGMIMGLVVNKADGKVTKAMLGKPGEKGKEIKIGDVYDTPMQKGPEGTADTCKIKLGSFPAMKVVQKAGDSTITSWAGTEGELEGVLLKSTGGGGDYELAEMPSTENVTAGDSVEVTKLKYSNGMEWWLTNDAVVTAFKPWAAEKGPGTGMFAMKTKDSTQEVKEVSSKAAAQLKWE